MGSTAGPTSAIMGGTIAMTLRPLLALLCVAATSFVAGCHARPESLLPAGVSSRAERQDEFLGSEAQTFVVLGDPQSFVWPTLLEELLYGHAQPRHLQRVLNAAVPQSGIGAWTSSLEPSALRALGDELARASRTGAAPRPRTALCLVSLRGLGDEGGPVKSENDMVGAEMGANALERLALELRQRGIERVVFATPIHVADAGPELAFEHVAIERLLARGHDFVAAGPDLFRATRRYFPDAYEEGGTRLNEFGLKLVAEEWYRWLAGPGARESVIEALYAEDFDVQAIEAAASAEAARRMPVD